MSLPIRPTHASGGVPSSRQALETYWRQLELTPHQRITPGIMAFTGRAAILRDSFVRTNGVSVGLDPYIMAMNWTELGVVPVGGQGLTEQERTWCAYAGQAMAALFAEEMANG